MPMIYNMFYRACERSDGAGLGLYIVKEFVEKLTGKMGMSAEFASEMVDYINYISVQDHVIDRELIKLNKYIDEFYIQDR